MQLSDQTITRGGVVGHPVGVTSIKGLYYVANRSLEQAIREIWAAGHDGAPAAAATAERSGYLQTLTAAEGAR